MLRTDAPYIAEEYAAAERFAELHRKKYRMLRQRLQTANYREDSRTIAATPENIGFAWVTWMKRQLAFTAPVSRVRAEWQQQHAEIAKWMETAQGKWSRRSELGEEWGDFIFHALTGLGIMKVGLEQRGDQSGEAGIAGQGRGGIQPFAVCVSDEKFSMDPRCNRPSKARLQFHTYEKDIDELPTVRGVDPAALEYVTNSYDQNGRGVKGVNPQGETADRRRVTLVDVWIPELAQLGTLCASGQGNGCDTWLKPPTSWWGQPDGPFVTLGFEWVGDDPWPISRLQAVWEQLEDLWKHETGAAIEMAGTKTFIGVEASNTAAQKTVKEARPNEVVPIEGLNRNEVQVINTGGVHPQRMEHINGLREIVNDMLSFTQAQRGLATGAATLGENQIAQANADVIVEGMRQDAAKAGGKVYEAVGFYQFKDPNYVERIEVQQKVTDPTTGQQSQQPVAGMLHGGTDGGWIDGTYFPPQDVQWPDDFSVTVLPNSMSHVTDQQKLADAGTLFDVLERGYMALVQMPGMEPGIRYCVDASGEAMDHRDLFETLFPPEVVMMASQQGLMAAMNQQLPEGANPALAMSGMGQPKPMGGLGGGGGAGGMGRVAPGGGGSRNPSPDDGPGLMRSAMSRGGTAAGAAPASSRRPGAPQSTPRSAKPRQ